MIGHLSGKKLISFHPETAFSRCSSVNLQAYLYGVTVYASAQALDFLATTENCSFPIWKLNSLSSRVSGWQRINPCLPRGLNTFL